MKRIGYIYKYNEQEKKGLLFYSCSWQKPIKFFIDDCISNVKTNQLVYFDFVDSKSVKNIECASLSNFRKEIIKEIVSYYDDSQDWQLGDKKSCICFENLLDIISYDKHGEMRNVDIPESIDELYNFFGAFEHLDYDLDEGFDDESSIYVNILDISYWINQNNLEQKYYGKTAGEILNLFDWFVRKKKSAHEKFGKNNHVYDISISPTWGLLLSFLSEKELRELYINEILFQPVLPEVFCGGRQLVR